LYIRFQESCTCQLSTLQGRKVLQAALLFKSSAIEEGLKLAVKTGSRFGKLPLLLPISYHPAPKPYWIFSEWFAFLMMISKAL
jgi:hypothetical protein